jgi:hypothetical protein
MQNVKMGARKLRILFHTLEGQLTKLTLCSAGSQNLPAEMSMIKFKR